MARIIKADDLKTVGAARATVLNLRDLAAQASQVVLDARKEAAAIVSRARVEAKSLRDDAISSGRQDGLEQGRAQAEAQALASARDELAPLVELLRNAAEEFSSARAEVMRRANQQMLDLAIELAAKIVHQVAVTDIGAARRNLSKALELANASGDIVIKVNPGQLRRLQEHCRELTEALAVQGTVRLVADEKISPGGVKLLSGCGEIDATIQTQLANVAQSLVGGIGNLFEPPGAGQALARGVYVSQSPPRQADSCVCDTEAVANDV